jgi:HEPN domain-containing protein
MTFTAVQRSYVEWQNRATRFYLAARRLYQSELFAPAAYCATISIELILKATLVYWDKSFDPEASAHGMAKLVRIVNNKLPQAKGFSVPEYFYFEQRYLMVSRYPKAAKGLGIPSSFLQDLDTIFCQLVPMVPFQHNTELKHVLRGRDRRTLDILRRNNESIRSLRAALSRGPQ